MPCFAIAAVYGGEQKGLNHIIVGCRMGGKKTGQTVVNGCEYRFSDQAARPPPRRRAPEPDASERRLPDLLACIIEDESALKCRAARLRNGGEVPFGQIIRLQLPA